MPVCCIYMCCTFHYLESARKVLLTRLKKNNKWSSWITRHRYARFVNDEEVAAGLKAIGKKPYIHNPDCTWTILRT